MPFQSRKNLCYKILQMLDTQTRRTWRTLRIPGSTKREAARKAICPRYPRRRTVESTKVLHHYHRILKSKYISSVESQKGANQWCSIVSLRAKKVLLLYKVYGGSVLLVPRGALPGKLVKRKLRRAPGALVYLLISLSHNIHWLKSHNSTSRIVLKGDFCLLPFLDFPLESSPCCMTSLVCSDPRERKRLYIYHDSSFFIYSALYM